MYKYIEGSHFLEVYHITGAIYYNTMTSSDAFFPNPFPRQSQLCDSAFREAMRLTTSNTHNNPKTTIDTNTRLKLSGKRSKPFDGDVRAKKISGPPKANMRDCDSSAVYDETMDVAESTVLLYVKAMRGTAGISSLYLDTKGLQAYE